MDLSKKISSGLTTAGDPVAVSDEAFSCLLDSVFAFNNRRSQVSEKLIQNTEAKQAHTALLTLLLEACKSDCDSNQVSAVLEDCKVPSDRSAKFIKKYEENKSKIQQILSTIGRTTDHVVDVSWRQDCIIKTSTCEKVGEPNYIISFKALNPQSNSLTNITFGCTLEQLQDLVFKLKDATKCIERTAMH